MQNIRTHTKCIQNHGNTPVQLAPCSAAQEFHVGHARLLNNAPHDRYFFVTTGSCLFLFVSVRPSGNVQLQHSFKICVCEARTLSIGAIFASVCNSSCAWWEQSLSICDYPRPFFTNLMCIWCTIILPTSIFVDVGFSPSQQSCHLHAFAVCSKNSFVYKKWMNL